MNHRELVLSARKKAKFGFLQLPEELQDEVIDKLDGQQLTLEGARDYLKEAGYSLSHEAIAGYYRAVRRERRIYDATQEVTRMFEAFADQPLEENLRSFANYLVAVASQKLADGEVMMKVDLGTVLKAFAGAGKAEGRGQRAEGGNAGGDEPASKIEEKKKGLSQDAVAMLRREILGMKG